MPLLCESDAYILYHGCFMISATVARDPGSGVSIRLIRSFASSLRFDSYLRREQTDIHR